MERKHTILLLEDDEDISELVQMILEEEGFKVIAFNTVKDFSNRDLEIIPDLFLLDVRLPDGSGIDVCGELMTVVDTPVIIMSAHATLEKIHQRCTPVDFIEKPFDLQSLIDRIKAQLPVNG